MNKKKKLIQKPDRLHNDKFKITKITIRIQFSIWTYTQNIRLPSWRWRLRIQSSPKHLCTLRDSGRRSCVRATRRWWTRRRATTSSAVRSRLRRTGSARSHRDAPSWSRPTSSPEKRHRRTVSVGEPRQPSHPTTQRPDSTYLILVLAGVGRDHQSAVHLGVQAGRSVLALGADLRDERGFGNDHGVGGRVRFRRILAAGRGGAGRSGQQRHGDKQRATYGVHFPVDEATGTQDYRNGRSKSTFYLNGRCRNGKKKKKTADRRR